VRGLLCGGVKFTQIAVGWGVEQKSCIADCRLRVCFRVRPRSTLAPATLSPPHSNRPRCLLINRVGLVRLRSLVPIVVGLDHYRGSGWIARQRATPHPSPCRASVKASSLLFVLHISINISGTLCYTTRAYTTSAHPSTPFVVYQSTSSLCHCSPSPLPLAFLTPVAGSIRLSHESGLYQGGAFCLIFQDWDGRPVCFVLIGASSLLAQNKLLGPTALLCFGVAPAQLPAGLTVLLLDAFGTG